MMPTKCWQAKTPQEMTVRTRFVPLKQSTQRDLSRAKSSCTVCSIAASLSATSVGLL